MCITKTNYFEVKNEIEHAMCFRRTFPFNYLSGVTHNRKFIILQLSKSTITYFDNLTFDMRLKDKLNELNTIWDDITNHE